MRFIINADGLHEKVRNIAKFRPFLTEIKSQIVNDCNFQELRDCDGTWTADNQEVIYEASSLIDIFIKCAIELHTKTGQSVDGSTDVFFVELS